jgi:exodeoxyribonuclease V beta subunit
MNARSHFIPYLAYSASAGSGKTFALAVRYIALLFMGESPSVILAATFTNKAAAEMRQRVLESLRSFGENRPFLEAVMRESGLSEGELLLRKAEVLEKFLKSSSHIVTLDSFFTGILRSASFELDIEPDFITQTKSKEDIEKHFIEEVASAGSLIDLVNLTMDMEDRNFGKIFEMMQHFYRIDPMLPSYETTTHSLATIEKQIMQMAHEMVVMLEEAGASKTAMNNFTQESVSLLSKRKLFAKESLLDARNYKKYALQNGALERLFLSIKESILEWITMRESMVFEHIFGLYSYYKNATLYALRRSSTLTFDDLGYLVYRLLHETISRDFLYFKIDTKFQHILLDEFQDTSTLQSLLLQPLLDEIVAGQGQREFRSFFYVGDTKQSLYRFRGGVEELFDRVALEYGIAIKQMDTNYRSARLIVEMVNRWFMPHMPEYVPQKSHDDAPMGYVAVVESESLLQTALEQAKELLARGIDIDEITFLVSTNKDGQKLQEQCEREGVATILKTSSSLKSLPKIASLVAMCDYLFRGAKIDAYGMLLRTNSRLEEVDLGWFTPFLSPLEVLHRLVGLFGYFDRDPNILKLLNFASAFRDIPSFLEDFERSDITVASNTMHGAKIMTIHSSKGLQFGYVIVMDKLSGKMGDRSPLLYYYNEDLELEHILYRLEQREVFDPLYAKVLEHRNALSHKDSLNVLYVALTRAVEGLIVVRKSKGSLFDAIGLQEMREGKLRQNFDPKEVEGVACFPIDQLSYYGMQESIIEEEEEEGEAEALLFGSALHYTLELLEGFEACYLEEALTSTKHRYGQQLSSSAYDTIAQRVLHLIDSGDFQQFLEGATLRKEQTLSYQGELKKIDMLLEYPHSRRIVEYKSSKKFAIEHQKQVARYQEAVESMSHLPTHAVIVYLLADCIEMVHL